LSTLRQLIADEIAKRDNSENMQPAFVLAVCDGPGAMTDTATAVTAIIEQTERNDASAMVRVARAIGEQVGDALEKKFPRRTIISHPIIAPGQSLRERGQLDERPELEPGRDHDALDRALDRSAERVARIRGGVNAD
jgi:hypothetical protein